jgi:hypothetical protein
MGPTPRVAYSSYFQSHLLQRRASLLDEWRPRSEDLVAHVSGQHASFDL